MNPLIGHCKAVDDDPHGALQNISTALLVFGSVQVFEERPTVLLGLMQMQ